MVRMGQLLYVMLMLMLLYETLQTEMFLKLISSKLFRTMENFPNFNLIRL